MYRKNFTTKAEPMSSCLKVYRDDYIGQKFGKLTVIAYPLNRQNVRGGGALCVCDCGNQVFVGNMRRLVMGETIQCAACSRKQLSERMKSYHQAHPTGRRGRFYEYRDERLYKVWCGMKQRCRHTAGPYADVSMCDEWQDYPVFREWAYSHGYDDEAPKMQCTIDRINPFGDYEPGNCRFADLKTQARNKRYRWLNLDEEQRAALLMESTPTN